MRFRNTARFMLLLCLTAVVLSACIGKTPSIPRASETPASSPVAPTISVVPTTLVVSTTAVATAEITGVSGLQATATHTPAATPAVTRASSIPSGWTVYSNPDYVRGLAIQGRTLWAATLGGVIAWDLNQNTPTLYGPREGLAEIQANGVAYCSDPVDRIYIAHSSSILSVYDLSVKKWSRLPVNFEDGSTFKDVQAIYCDTANHRLLAGSPEGLGILDLQTGRWRKFGPKQGLKVDTVRAIDVAGQAIWAAAGDKGAYLIQGSLVFPFDSASGFPSGRVNDLSVASDASLWLAYSNGLVHYQNKKWTPYGAQSPTVIPFQTVDFVRVGPDKRVWIASAAEGACPFDTVTFFCATVYPGIHGAPVTDLAVGSDGIAYLGTDGGGVLVLHDNYVSQLTFAKKQLISDNVQDIAEDASGRVWISTDRGINLVDPAHPDSPWQVLTPQRGGLAYAQVSGLLPSANGMWLWYPQVPQVSFLNGQDWLHLDASKGLSGPVVAAVLDQRGGVWFATAHTVQSWDGSIMRSYTPPAVINSGAIHTLLNVGDSLWVGTDRGLLRYQRFQWKNVLPDIPVNAILADQNGELLLGTDQGLIRFDGNQSYQWIINLGTQVVNDPRVTTIARDGSGRLWVGTAGQGAFSYNGTHWEQFDSATGLPTDYVRKIFTDHLGAVWIAAVTGEGGGGIVHLVP